MKNNRRKFIKSTAIASAGAMIVPRHVLGGIGYVSPSDQIRIATIGAGGKGKSDTFKAAGLIDGKGKATEQIVALCDVDYKQAEKTFEKFPSAKKYKDYRKMLAEMDSEIDAVIISGPDHMHAHAGLDAISRGKHVYIQKPLAHDVAEARALTEAAAKYNIVSQMGNQGSSSDDIRRISEWIDAGLIGEVRNVHCWTNRPVWEQAHVQAFAPFHIRNWSRIDSFEAPPLASTVHYDFPERDGMPPVHLVWYDGGMMPPRPAELGDDEDMGDWSGGVIFEGSEGKIMCGCYASNPRLLPTSLMDGLQEPKQSIERVKEPNHQQNIRTRRKR